MLSYTAVLVVGILVLRLVRLVPHLVLLGRHFAWDAMPYLQVDVDLVAQVTVGWKHTLNVVSIKCVHLVERALSTLSALHALFVLPMVCQE